MKKYFLLAIIPTLFAIVAAFDIQTAVSDGTGDCNSNLDDPFIKIGQNYYIIDLTIAKSWYGAIHFCRTKGAHLISIESEEEWQPLSTYLMSNAYNHPFWIGANDFDTTFEFFWISSGQPMFFTKWMEGEPNNAGGNEKCVLMGSSGDKIVMNDMECHNLANFICKANSPKTISINFTF